MGILNSKENIFDIILTDQGSESLITEGLKIVYYSFSDSDVSYHDVSTASIDIPVSKLMLESNKLPNDSTMPTYLEDGTLNNYYLHDKSLNTTLFNGNIVENQTLLNSNNTEIEDLKLKFDQYLKNINSELSNKTSLHTLNDFEYSDLSIDKSKFSFVLSKELKLTFGELIPKVSNIENLTRNYPQGVLNDPKFSGDTNFKKLTPFIDSPRSDRFFLLENGKLPNPQPQLNKEKIKEKLEKTRRANLSSVFRIEETSANNNLAINFFTYSNGNNSTFSLLNIIDGGTIVIDNKIKNILFVGKLLKRSDDIVFFANIFTILID
jgi:hypothetical protein